MSCKQQARPPEIFAAGELDLARRTGATLLSPTSATASSKPAFVDYLRSARQTSCAHAAHVLVHSSVCTLGRVALGRKGAGRDVDPLGRCSTVPPLASVQHFWCISFPTSAATASSSRTAFVTCERMASCGRHLDPPGSRDRVCAGGCVDVSACPLLFNIQAHLRANALGDPRVFIFGAASSPRLRSQTRLRLQEEQPPHVERIVLAARVQVGWGCDWDLGGDRQDGGGGSRSRGCGSCEDEEIHGEEERRTSSHPITADCQSLDEIRAHRAPEGRAIGSIDYTPAFRAGLGAGGGSCCALGIQLYTPTSPIPRGLELARGVHRLTRLLADALALADEILLPTLLHPETHTYPRRMRKPPVIALTDIRESLRFPSVTVSARLRLMCYELDPKLALRFRAAHVLLVELPEHLNPHKKDGVQIYVKLMSHVPATNVKSFPALNMILRKKGKGKIVRKHRHFNGHPGTYLRHSEH
ncbi:hypothetical protein C8R44DRAFT_876526 [Mycena epipterygia]|nr:hypothetical protein C8R44DRAFT_876526 [Mycena epipterygia]